jgi:hypothetical protein
MPEKFLQLKKEDRADALGFAAEKLVRPAYLLEKDVWVVWALSAMFGSKFGPSLVFKGGTSLSKAYGAINRFSEDIDLTYDIRALVPELVSEGNNEHLPPTKSQQKKWREVIEQKLATWVSGEVLPLIQNALNVEALPAHASVDPKNADTVRIEYEHTSEGTGYVKPVVVLEFGAKSTGEPCATINVTCDAAPSLPALTFPVSAPRVMKVERTFWEKATAVHVMSLGGKLRNDRYSRHWYDLVQLDARGHVTTALAAKDVANQVVRHKSVFFVEKAGGVLVDYAVAVTGGLVLVPPPGATFDQLKSDYGKMVEDGLLQAPVPTFDELMAKAKELERRVNLAMGNAPQPSGPT